MNSIDIKYTVIIPHYNAFNLLERCLNSIPEREDIQVIVEDDKSDKNEYDTFKNNYSYRSNVQLVYNAKNHGAGYCRNAGLRLAKGKWIIFADADDYFTANAFNYFDEFISSNADIIYFNYEIKNESGLRQIQQTNIENIKNYKRTGKSNRLRTSNWEPWGKMFNASFIKQNNIVFHETRIMNDAFFTVKAGLNASRIDVSENKVYVYEIYPNSVSRKIDNVRMLISIKECLLINKEILSHKGYIFNTIDVLIPILHYIIRFHGKDILKLKDIIKECGLNIGIPFFSMKNKIRTFKR